jgi:hypothetical protein
MLVLINLTLVSYAMGFARAQPILRADRADARNAQHQIEALSHGCCELESIFE